MAFQNSIPSPDILSAEQYSLNNVKNTLPNVDKAMQSADNKIKLQSDVMALQDQQQDQSDQAKIATAMRGLNPSDPNYADNLVKAASDSGISSKALLTLRQNLYVDAGQQLKNDFTKNQIQEQVAKMSDDQAARLGTMIDQFKSNQSALIDQYDRLTQQNGGKPPTPSQIAGLNAQRVAQIDAGIQELQDKEFHGLLDKKAGDAQIAQLQQAKAKPFDINGIRDSYDHTSAYMQALDAKKQQLGIQNQAKDLQLKDSEIAKNDAAAQKTKDQQAGLEYTPEGRALFDQVVAKDQSGLRGLTGKDRVAFFNDQAKSGTTADEIIAQRAQTKGISTEAQSLYKQKSILEKNETAITKPGGLLDNAQESIDAVNFDKLKKAGQFENWTKEQESDPTLYGYKVAIQELRAEYSQVLAKGGQQTDGTRNEAHDLVPDIITKGQFSQIRKQIENGVKTNKDALNENIRNIGKSGDSSGQSSGGPTVSWDSLK